MHDTQERMNLVKQRARVIRQKRERRARSVLVILCLVLSTALVHAFRTLTCDKPGGSVQGMLGASLMFEDAGAYVLVGVLSFSAAVLITILGLHYKHREDKRKRSTTNPEDTRNEEDET